MAQIAPHWLQGRSWLGEDSSALLQAERAGELFSDSSLNLKRSTPQMCMTARLQGTLDALLEREKEFFEMLTGAATAAASTSDRVAPLQGKFHKAACLMI